MSVIRDQRHRNKAAGRAAVLVGSALLALALAPPAKPAAPSQAITGRVLMAAAGTAGTPPANATVFAYSDAHTPAASAPVQPDGTYTLPVPPGTYLLSAEAFGNLYSQRQVVSVAAGQPLANVNLSLLQGQEVSGTLRDDQGQPLANAPVQAALAGDAAPGAVPFATQSFTDGSYTLVLPPGQYTVAARGRSQVVSVADEPLDGIDFPPPAPGPAPGVGTIVTVAGNGITGYGGDGRSAVNARLGTVHGLAVDKAGNLYLSDWLVGRIRKVTPDGMIRTTAGSTPFDWQPDLDPGPLPPGDISGKGGPVFGFSGDGGPAAAAQLDDPEYVAVDAAGNLYISDQNNNRVRKVDASTGVITTVAGSGPEHAIGGFSGDGGPATAARLDFPAGLALDTAGNLYIADVGNRRVRKVGLDGTITTVAGGGSHEVTAGAKATAVRLGYVFGLAVDMAGNLYLTDGPGINHFALRILKVSPDGTIRRVAGTGSSSGGQDGFSGDGGKATAALLGFPLYLAADSAGNLFVSDYQNHRIRKIDTNGIITTVVGSGPHLPLFAAGGFAGDGGPATSAQLSFPGGIAIDAAGNLYIADEANHRVREVIGIAAPGLLGGG